MINLVTIKQAERKVRLDVDETTLPQLADLEDIVQHASAIVFDYLKIPVPEFTSPVEDSPTYDFWASTTVPYEVQRATLLIVGELWLNREASSADVLSDAVKALLIRHRDPAMA